jgi:protein tyrosine/serine phosphatase
MAAGPSILEVLTPPPHFAIVEPSVYRSTMPTSVTFPYLKQLNLRTVIVLSADSVARNVAAFFADSSASLVHTGAAADRTDAWKKPTWKPMSEEVVKTSLQLLLSADTHPVLICDTSGVQQVGVVIGCLRRLQGWNLNSIINEYRGFALTRTRYLHEQMIELFDTDLVVIPEEPPQWYCDQLEMERQEADEYDEFVRHDQISPLGVLINVGSDGDCATDTDAYRKYYYSAEGPLNSREGAEPPVLNLLNQ